MPGCIPLAGGEGHRPEAGAVAPPRRARVLPLLALAVTLSAAPPAAATLQVALEVRGTVTGDHGEPLPGATVEVRPEEASRTEPLSSRADADGVYRVRLVNGSRRHRFTVSAPGHQTMTRVVKPLTLPYESKLAGRKGILTLRLDFALTSEDALIERALADAGHGEVPAEELRWAASALHARGVEAATAGDLERAESLLRQACRLDPERLAARGALARVVHDRGEVEAFLALAAEARAAGLRDPGLDALRCAVLAEQGHAREVELAPVLADLRREDPAAAAGCLRRLAAGAASAGYPDWAATRLEQALEIAPRDVETLYLASVVAERLGDRAAVTAHLETLLALAPADPRTDAVRHLVARMGIAEPAAAP